MFSQVNIQHQLTTSAGLGADRGMTSTNQLHDAMGHRAAAGVNAIQAPPFLYFVRAAQSGYISLVILRGEDIAC